MEIGTPTGNQKYTLIFLADEDGQWESSNSDWDWQINTDTPSTSVENIELKTSLFIKRIN